MRRCGWLFDSLAPEAHAAALRESKNPLRMTRGARWPTNVEIVCRDRFYRPHLHPRAQDNIAFMRREIRHHAPAGEILYYDSHLSE